ncbi:hypothetical protein [Candidatus Binatus sp.]|uniref:hypothetical protein n=1 Tax=Candidatus Binatus sp. TaxID=2811406 RepID=UPI003CB809DE
MAKNGLQRAVIACAVVLGLVEIVAPGGCVSAAGEAGQHIAQLPSTEAKCKYVLELCARARRYDAAYLSAKKDVERDSSVENIDRYREAFVDSSAAATELSDAAKAVALENGKSPKCFEPCADLIDHQSDGDMP